MSRIFNESVIICPCQKPTVDFAHEGNTHHLSTLFFCPSCQSNRCQDCSVITIDSKYCTKCLHDFSSNDVHCSRNCFTCPTCFSDLAISASNAFSEGKEGKVFKFKCTYCKYHYKTSPVFRPRPLVGIINSEMKEKDEYHQAFDRYDQSMKSQQTIDRYSAHSKVDQDTLLRMKKLNLDKLTKFDESIAIEQKLKLLDSLEFSQEEDLANVESRASVSSLSQFPSINNTLETGSLISDMFSAKYPIPRSLAAKKSFKCWQCNNILQQPNIEHFKFNIKWNAIDVFPSIKVYHKVTTKVLKGTVEYNCILNFMNPLDKEVRVNLSTLNDLPSNYLSNPRIRVQVHFPVSEFTISGKNQSKELIKSIPTNFLTRNTAATRAEIMMRMGAKMQNRDHHEFEIDSSVDRGPSWYSVPLSISWENAESISDNEKSEPLSLRVPIYLIIDSELPETIRALQLSKERLKAGCWYILDIGRIKLA